MDRLTRVGVIVTTNGASGRSVPFEDRLSTDRSLPTDAPNCLPTAAFCLSSTPGLDCPPTAALLRAPSLLSLCDLTVCRPPLSADRLCRPPSFLQTAGLRPLAGLPADLLVCGPCGLRTACLPGLSADRVFLQTAVLRPLAGLSADLLADGLLQAADLQAVDCLRTASADRVCVWSADRVCADRRRVREPPAERRAA